MAENANEFIFPTAGPLPHRDSNAGIAFQNGGVRGVYQAGVIHGLVLSGYFPRTIGGTSVGSLSGAILAFAAEISDHARRMDLVDDYLAAWEKNPGADVLTLLRDGPAGQMVRDLVDINLSLGELLDFVGATISDAPLHRKFWPLIRLWSALPGKLGRCIAGAWFEEYSRGHREGMLAVRVVQRVLDAYAMPTALLDIGPIGRWFGGLIEEYGPKGKATTFRDLTRSDLVFQLANLSRQGRIFTLGKPTEIAVPGMLVGGRLLDALEASSSFGPLFAGRRLRDVVEHVPAAIDQTRREFTANDLVMDAASVQKDALAPVIKRWINSGDDGPYRLFAAYHSPLGPTKGSTRSLFFGPALRSLELRDDLDLTYNADIVSLITEMLDELQAAGKEPPPRPRGTGRYVPIRTSAIAPRRKLPVALLSAPDPGELREAAALGCRAALEALHRDTIKRLKEQARGGPVECKDVLDEVRKAQQDEAHRDEYFKPLPRLCAVCDRKLEPPYEPERRSRKEVKEANDFAPFHKDRQLTIVVPAGGVFLGVFQFGAIAALKEYKVIPDLYAGASVGTIFSYLLQSSLQNDALRPVVDLTRTLPDWIDRGPQGTARLDAIGGAVKERWSSGSPGLRALRLRDVVDLFTTETLPAERQANWLTFQAGLRDLLFTPIEHDRASGQRLDAKYGLGPEDRDELRRMFTNLARNRLSAVVEPDAKGRPAPLDRIAANLGFYDPAATTEGEILGFRSIEEKLREICFPGVHGAGPTLAEYSEEKKVRFIFTVTNHTQGTIEYLGYDDGIQPDLGSPHAVQAALAASSFPLAFRRRTREEIFGEHTDAQNDKYADGGIFNNFPSDTAFGYLRDLTDKEETKWIGARPHRVLLLSLTSPPKIAGEIEGELGLVATTLRSLSMSEDEKVSQTLNSQEHINTLAEAANPILAAAGKRQAIRADMQLIAPTYSIYPHAFALKPYLGFDPKKELEMLASGCRRARIALEWDAYQGENPHADLVALRARFARELRAEISKVYASNTCVFGRFSHTRRPTACAFADGTMDAVFEACKKTAPKELDVHDLKLSRKLYPR